MKRKKTYLLSKSLIIISCFSLIFSEEIIYFDGFESGDLTTLNWETSGDALWTVDGQDAYEGVFSAHSGSIDNSQISTLTLVVDIGCLGGSQISFNRKVSTEFNFDFDSAPRKFIDVETGEQVNLFAENVKEEYEKSVSQYFKNIEETCIQYRIKYVPVSVEEKFEKILTTYLVEKQKFG